MQKKRCLIITSDAGFGHRSAALSVSKALEVLYPNQVEILVTNPIQETDTPTVMKPIEKGYDRSVRFSPGLYRLSYEVSDFAHDQRGGGGRVNADAPKNNC